MCHLLASAHIMWDILSFPMCTILHIKNYIILCGISHKILKLEFYLKPSNGWTETYIFQIDPKLTVLLYI